ncbi:PREDICTED: protein EARLY-RESPONSIVE TO DEHYDRATION 7, chloroplastic-like isoform X2 [Camelina sativa]|uniref:Protein EARLY-RESPONSIVE TO DEHYDRATION 7, chloroplastic-like isoform X1 n=1 Tax=Camelina sativa TaxID=90675 RepID=A0ABM0SMG8_CAMSA|nr:PREDICTED: protein EARLY-RESPONSIVE TO DEHYDRATION 7, chloroplastic-like isoform X1 [Camelina sativa]XP_010413404.1 PREDICTED: protein EARLY-RESPONSIVE TO DEHYDRATION 7, chloroplastic-like isoform X2 [Camelina sativa]
MASSGDKQASSLYPAVDTSNPEAPPLNPSSSSSSTNNLYPSLDMNDLARNLFPEQPETNNPSSVSAPPAATEEVILKISGAILHLIDKSYSVELACGDLSIIRIVQGDKVVAVLASVAGEIQWPLTKDENSVKVDESHYFFTLRPTSDEEDGDVGGKKNSDEMLNYGLTIASKGQEHLLVDLEKILEDYSCFTVQQVSEEAKEAGEMVLDVTVARETSPVELTGERKEIVERQCSAYWTTLAPNVEDYSGKAAKLIATGSGHLIKGILWCGDVTMDRLIWGNGFMKRRLSKAEKESEVHPDTLKRIRRVKQMTKMTENVANSVLSGVLKVSGFFTSSVANTKVGKKFFSLLPGEVILASLDGFNKVCDAVEVAGRNVMSTSSTVTTELVDHKYGGKAAEATNEGLDAAGYAFGTAWAAFKIRKAINPKSVLKPSTLAKTAIRSAASQKKA